MYACSLYIPNYDVDQNELEIPKIVNTENIDYTLTQFNNLKVTTSVWKTEDIKKKTIVTCGNEDCKKAIQESNTTQVYKRPKTIENLIGLKKKLAKA